MDYIKNFLDRVDKTRVSVGVVGDAMLDECYDVSVSRVSPEFPVPVMLSASGTPSHVSPGGAANAANQFRHFNADVRLFGVIDDHLAAVLEDTAVDFSGCVGKNTGWERGVPVKRRFYHGDFPVQRWDVETPCPEFYRTELRGKFPADFKPGALVLSDYGKGAFADPADKNFWVTRGIPTVVDPKSGDPREWKGCTVFKPNKAEADRMSSPTDNWKWQCEYFLDKVGCEHVVITDAGDAVYGLDGKNGFFHHRNENPLPARSVVGAGDCFAAVFALAYCHGFPVSQCADIAFHAGQVYVQEVRNTPVTPYRLMRSVDPLAAKFMTPEWDGKLIFSNGCFDIMHAGHVSTLVAAKKLGGTLVVAVNDDASVTALKGSGRPVVPLGQRMTMLAALGCVDFVVPFSGEDGLMRLIAGLKPDVVVKGGEYAGRYVAGSGSADVVLAPMVEGVSTTSLVERVTSLRSP